MLAGLGLDVQGFGGVSSGPEPLRRLHGEINKVLSPLIGKPITITAIVDLMNLIGRCVVSGNLRQTAEISFGDPHSVEYIDLKNYEVNPHRAEYGWTRSVAWHCNLRCCADCCDGRCGCLLCSNNSVFATVGMDYSNICERINNNGEPGKCAHAIVRYCCFRLNPPHRRC